MAETCDQHTRGHEDERVVQNAVSVGGVGTLIEQGSECRSSESQPHGVRTSDSVDVGHQIEAVICDDEVSRGVGREHVWYDEFRPGTILACERGSKPEDHIVFALSEREIATARVTREGHDSGWAGLIRIRCRCRYEQRKRRFLFHPVYQRCRRTRRLQPSVSPSLGTFCRRSPCEWRKMTGFVAVSAGRARLVRRHGRIDDPLSRFSPDEQVGHLAIREGSIQDRDIEDAPTPWTIPGVLVADDQREFSLPIPERRGPLKRNRHETYCDQVSDRGDERGVTAAARNKESKAATRYVAEYVGQGAHPTWHEELEQFNRVRESETRRQD